ncbi:MAG: AAA family ATPase [Verrucomicrobiales bacterium]
MNAAFFQDTDQAFFRFGPRGTGKTWWTRAQFPDALRVDLLDPGTLREMAARPERLRERLARDPRVETVVIDEVQKLPELLEVVHGLIEENNNSGHPLIRLTSRDLGRFTR